MQKIMHPFAMQRKRLSQWRTNTAIHMFTIRVIVKKNTTLTLPKADKIHMICDPEVLQSLKSQALAQMTYAQLAKSCYTMREQKPKSLSAYLQRSSKSDSVRLLPNRWKSE